MSHGSFKLAATPPRGRRTADAPRSERLPSFIDMPPGAVTALDDLRVAVIGAGSVGRNIVDRLARLQIPALYIVDPGRFKAESLLTHPVGVEDVRRRAGKAASAARLALSLSPSTSAYSFNGPIQDLDPAALVDADVVAVATDNLAAEVATTQRCLQLRKPLVHAAVHGASLVAQIRWYTNSGGGPCIRCGFSELEKEHLDSNTEFSCTGVTGQQHLKPAVGPPTMSIASLCSMAGDLAVMSILRHALQLGAPLTDSEVEFCGYTNQTVVSPLRPKSETCPCNHDPWQVESSPKPLRSVSLAELITASGAGGNGSMNGLAIQVDNRLFVEVAACSDCGYRPIRKFVLPGKKAGFCRCGKAVYAQPFFSRRLVPASVVKDVLDRPLCRIGAGGARGVLVSNTERAVLFVDNS